jgi:hypothetical protein
VNLEQFFTAFGILAGAITILYLICIAPAIMIPLLLGALGTGFTVWGIVVMWARSIK